VGISLSTKSKYKCHYCGYTAQVWDAPDKSPITTVDTRHCLGCKSLVEVPIEFHGGGLIEGPDVVPSFLNRCPDCNSSNVKPWDAKHSCPKCGEPYDEGSSSSQLTADVQPIYGLLIREWWVGSKQKGLKGVYSRDLT